MSLISEICFQLARKRVLRHQPGLAGANPASFDKNSYSEWRQSELGNQFMSFFSPSEIAKRDVLDFGCGEGELSLLMSQFGVRTITGIEISEERYRAALDKADNAKLPVKPRFLLATKPSAIDLPKDSVDVILCFDVLEHIMEYERIVQEWHRILRHEGKVLIYGGSRGGIHMVPILKVLSQSLGRTCFSRKTFC